jgi:hypothetical protein
MCYPRRGKSPPLNDLHHPKTPLHPMPQPKKVAIIGQYFLSDFTTP